MSSFDCFWRIIDLQYHVSSCCTTVIGYFYRFQNDHDDKFSYHLSSYRDLHNYWIYSRHCAFHAVTHLFCYCKFVPLNPPHLFLSSPYPDTSFLFEVDPSGNSWTTETWSHHYFWNGWRRRLTEDLQWDLKPSNDPFCGSWWMAHPSWRPHTDWLSHAAVLTTSGLCQALAHLGPEPFPNADFPTCWFSASVPLPENWGPENSLPWICLLHCRKFSGISGLYPLDASNTTNPPPMPCPAVTTKMSLGTGKCPQMRTTALAGSSSSFRFQLKCHCL